MDASFSNDASRHGINDCGVYKVAQENREECGGHWYFSRREIEENSPSRRDGIDLKKETYLRKSYCTFLQDLGMRLKVPQVTIATAIIFCHRFFLRQSHATSDRRTIATVCMFLAGKVEETPRPLKDVILVSYEIIHKKDPAAIQRMKQKEVYEQQKELILAAERLVLATLAFDLNLHHPYKPLVEAIKKFKVAQNALAQVAWNFVNDGLRTSLCLQFKPHHIAAGAIFLAAKFLKVKLPSEGEKVWWQEFDVTPRQLEEVSNQMLELYEQNRMPPSQASEAEGSAGGAQQPLMKASTAIEDHATSNSNLQGGSGTSKAGTLKPALNRPHPNQSCGDNPVVPLRSSHSRDNEYESSDVQKPALNRPNPNQPCGDNPVVPMQRTHSRDNEYESSDVPFNLDRNGVVEMSDHHQQEILAYNGNGVDVQNGSRFNGDAQSENHEWSVEKIETGNVRELKDKYHGRALDSKDDTVCRSPQDAIKKLDKDKLKAAIEKRRKSRVDTTRKIDFMDEDDLIERELEDGIELVTETEKTKQERRQSMSKISNRSEHKIAPHDGPGDGHFYGMNSQSSHGEDSDHVEEGEVEPFDAVDIDHLSPKSSTRKRRAGSPPDNPMEGKQYNDYGAGSHSYNHLEFPEDRNRSGKRGLSERT